MGAASETLPSGTVTFLLTDVAGSTPQWDQNFEAMVVAMSRQRALLQRAVADHAGVHPVEQGEGDSMVGVFARAGDAVAAALQAQQTLLAERWPDGVHIEVRMGIHTGDRVVVTDGSYQGPAIIRCARLRNLGHGGQVLISSTTAALVADSIPDGCALVELGPHRLAGLRRPETVWQLSHPALPATFPPLPQDDTLRSALPVALTSFVGREDELADLADRFERNRLVTLVGSGGSGKTRLAAEFARRSQDRYPGGVWWVDLAAARSSEEATDAVFAAMALSEDIGRPRLDTLVNALARAKGPVLVVLDNCEHLLDGVADLVGRVMRAVTDVAFFATSREPLGVEGELIRRVPSLDPATDATTLFLDRAILVAAPTYEHERELISSICARLDGLPLAIELAAARVGTMPLERLAAGLDDAFRLLTGGPRTAVQRQQTMHACIAWSVDQLDDHDRSVLHRLAVFVDGFTAEAAAGVASDDDHDETSVVDALVRLVDKSLVTFDRTSSRYRLFEVVRQYGVEQLRAAGELAAARSRHARWFCSWVQALAPAGHRTDHAHEVIAGDHANVSAAIDFALEADAAAALETTACLCGYFGFAERSTEAARRFVALSERGPADTPLPWARALAALGVEAPWAGVVDVSELERARSIAVDHGDRWAELLARFGLAIPLSFAGDLTPSEVVAHEAEAAGMRDVELYARLQIGCMHNLFGRAKLAIAELDPVAAQMRRLGWTVMADLPAAHSAVALNFLGRPADALMRLDDLGQDNRANAVATLTASVYRVAGLLMADGDLVRQARAELRPDDWGLVRAIESMVTATEALVGGDLAGAAAQLELARPLQLMPAMQMGVDELLASCLTALGDIDRALQACERLAAAAAALESEEAAAASAVARAAIALCIHEPGGGERARDALQAAQAADNAVQIIDALELLAVISAREGGVAEARRLDADAEDRRQQIGYRWRWPHVEKLRQEAIAP